MFKFVRISDIVQNPNDLATERFAKHPKSERLDFRHLLYSNLLNNEFIMSNYWPDLIFRLSQRNLYDLRFDSLLNCPSLLPSFFLLLNFFFYSSNQRINTNTHSVTTENLDNVMSISGPCFCNSKINGLRLKMHFNPF